MAWLEVAERSRVGIIDQGREFIEVRGPAVFGSVEFDDAIEAVPPVGRRIDNLRF